MFTFCDIPEPVLFNPLKHHIGFIKEFIDIRAENDNQARMKEIMRELKHIGTSVMDIYTGILEVGTICHEVQDFLGSRKITSKEVLGGWTGTDPDEFKVISLSDESQWILKYHNNEKRFAHIFPARSSPHTFRIKSNTLKSAILYVMLIGKDYVTEEDLNKARALAGLSPVREVADTEAVAEMIEVLRA
jgi:hypothetical protein